MDKENVIDRVSKREMQVFPHLPKVCVMPLHFSKRPTLVAVFTNQKKPEEDFHFYENSHYYTKSRSFIKVTWCNLNIQKVRDTLYFMPFWHLKGFIGMLHS